MTAHEKLVQYLNEAHALEGALVQTLTVHIAMTPEGPYRDVLERHLGETRDQARALEERLSQIGASRSPFAQGLGLIEAVIGQALALGKAPWDLVRGSGGEERLLKNAKDECASEALEIATYDGIEALADALGDTATVALARRHRRQEERALEDLRGLIPALTEAMLAADVLGIESYDPSATGAADAVRGAARGVRDKAEDVAGDVREAAGEAGATARRTAGQARSGARRTTSKASGGGASRSRSTKSSSSRSRSGSSSGGTSSGGSTRARSGSGGSTRSRTASSRGSSGSSSGSGGSSSGS